MQVVNDKLVGVLAILWTIGALVIFFCAALGIFKGAESMQTQIVQGIFGLSMLIAGFYWGSSNAKKGTNNIQAQDNTSVTVSSSPTSEI